MLDDKLICEVKVKGGLTKRIVTTWKWYINYGWPYTVAILSAGD